MRKIGVRQFPPGRTHMGCRSSSAVGAGGTRTTVSLAYVPMIVSASRHRPSGVRPSWTARIPWRSSCRNMMTPRSVTPKCSKPWMAIGR
jgi:hypothetical protein